MTACKDVQDMNLGKKAVSAALAGTLAVGMVPGVALAATADDAVADDGIETLALSALQDFAAGSVSGIKIAGVAADVANIETSIDNVTSADAGKFKLPIALTQVTTSTGAVVNIGDQEGVTYEMLQSTSATAPTSWDGATLNTELASKTAGSYWVKATLPAEADITVDALEPYAGATIAFKLNIVNKSLSDAYMYQTIDGKEVKTFTYDSTEVTPSFKLPGAENPLTPTTDYSVEYYDVATGKKTTATDNGAAAEGGAPAYAGKYIAYVKGATDYLGSNVQIPFTIDQLNLATADLKVPTVTGSTAFAPVLVVNGKTIGASSMPALSALLDTAVSPIDNGEATSYTFTFKPAQGNKNIVGTKTVNTYRTADAVTKWQIGGTDAANQTSYACPDVILSAATNNKPFDISSVTALDAAGKELATTVTVTNTVTKEVVPASSANTPGSWTITYTVDAAANKYAVGGTYVVTTNVYAGVINNADVIVKQNGQVTDAPSFVYNGENVLPQIDVTVKSGDKTLVAGKDYTLKASLNGTDVAEAVNANATGENYDVTIDAPGYKFAAAGDNQFEITVDPCEIAVLQVADQINADTDDPTDDFLNYTGKAITPVLEYKNVATDKAWTALPADQFSLTYSYHPFDADGNVDTTKTSEPTEMKAAGEYTITIAPKNTTVAGNYTLTASTCKVIVKEGARVFEDVPSSAWYYEVVNKAATLQYMTGIGDTKLFKPNAKITRAEVVAVLFKMANGSGLGDDFSYDENSGYNTGFSDVKGNAWYAKAVAWAKNTGIVSGYGDGATFGPNDQITREQFAAMLCSYAKAMGNYAAVKDVNAVLADKTGGNQVSGWAKESVAWAVSKEYMGNGAIGIAPKNTVTRAEVAAMTVAYQPVAFEK